MSLEEMTVAELEALTLIDALDALGREIQRSRLGAGFRDPVDEARRWLEDHRERLQLTVCRQATTQKLRRGEPSSVDVATGLADSLAALKLGVAPFTIALTIAKIGLRRFCEGGSS
jgi:hypothetical protein